MMMVVQVERNLQLYQDGGVIHRFHLRLKLRNGVVLLLLLLLIHLLVLGKSHPQMFQDQIWYRNLLLLLF